MTRQTFDVEPSDPLEAELRQFRPAAPSRELSDRIGDALARPRGMSRLRPWYFGAALAAAACVILAFGIWRVTRPHVDPVQIGGTDSFPAVGIGADRPALATYRLALTRSPADLDALLDRHAARVLAGGDGPAGPITASSGFDLHR
jgi:hypothetical protein